MKRTIETLAAIERGEELIPDLPEAASPARVLPHRLNAILFGALFHGSEMLRRAKVREMDDTAGKVAVMLLELRDLFDEIADDVERSTLERLAAASEHAAKLLEDAPANGALHVVAPPVTLGGMAGTPKNQGGSDDTTRRLEAPASSPSSTPATLEERVAKLEQLEARVAKLEPLEARVAELEQRGVADVTTLAERVDMHTEAIEHLLEARAVAESPPTDALPLAPSFDPPAMPSAAELADELDDELAALLELGGPRTIAHARAHELVVRRLLDASGNRTDAGRAVLEELRRR